jgi:hypothetical protein
VAGATIRMVPASGSPAGPGAAADPGNSRRPGRAPASRRARWGRAGPLSPPAFLAMDAAGIRLPGPPEGLDRSVNLDRVGAQEARQVAAVRLPMLSVEAGRIGFGAGGASLWAARRWSTSSCRSCRKLSPGVELGADHLDHPQAFIGAWSRTASVSCCSRSGAGASRRARGPLGRGCQAAAALVAGC